MGGTYTCLQYHVVFSTKGREPWIGEDLRPRLYDYLGGIIRDEGGKLYAIGGMPDHLHLYFRYHTDGSLGELMRNLKSHSSGWIHREFSNQKSLPGRRDMVHSR